MAAIRHKASGAARESSPAVGAETLESKFTANMARPHGGRSCFGTWKTNTVGELMRREINQADGCVQRIAVSGAMSGSPFICAWVVRQKIAAGVELDKQLGNPAYGSVGAATFGTLVDTANARLLKLRTLLAERYGSSSTDVLLNRVFSQPTQDGLGI
jgi:hypothetical protein